MPPSVSNDARDIEHLATRYVGEAPQFRFNRRSCANAGWSHRRTNAETKTILRSVYQPIKPLNPESCDAIRTPGRHTVACQLQRQSFALAVKTG